MKTRKIAIAAILMLSIISITPRAEAAGKFKKHSTFSQTTVEPTLEIEVWMTNNYLWNPEYLVGIAANEDAKMEIEGWMVNTSLWNKQVAIADPKLTLENWMTSPMIWDYLALIPDTKMELENWMPSQDVWKSGSKTQIMNTNLML